MSSLFFNLIDWLTENCPRTEQDFRSSAIESANIVKYLGLDNQSIHVAMMYCYSPFSDKEKKKIVGRFGEQTVSLLEGVNKLDQLSRLFMIKTSADYSNFNEKNLRNLFLTMVDDVRVVLIKLAMQLQLLRHSKRTKVTFQKKIGRLTLDVYAPLANRLGIWQIKWEMEDYALRYLDRKSYKYLAKTLNEKRIGREEYIQNYINQLSRSLSESGIHAKISGRPKHIYSIWRKMQKKGLAFEHLLDIRAVRILVDNVADCYSALGIVHTNWCHLQGEFNDYIATPKSNGYRSIHTVVIGPNKKNIEVQIRTYAMHKENELGVAAHWRYKENATEDTSINSKILWLRHLLEWRDDLVDVSNISGNLKWKMNEKRIYVLTPKGTVIDLPNQSTPIDFAYAIHTEIGHRTKGAKINGKIVSLKYNLKTGDQVYIQTKKFCGPSRDWIRSDLTYTRTNRAKNRIQQWFKHKDYDQHVSEGRSILERAIHRFGINDVSYNKIAQSTHFHKTDDMLAALGSSDFKLSKALAPFRKVTDGTTFPFKIRSEQTKLCSKTFDFTVNGINNLLTHMANCCHPVPGDLIVGYMTLSRGITIHRRDCVNILQFRKLKICRLIEVGWRRTN